MADLSEDSMTLVVLGDVEVGKTSILERFVSGTFSKTYVPTAAVDFNAKVLAVDGSTVRVNIWDTSGRREYSFATEKHVREADGFVFVYDITKPESFRLLKELFTEVQKLAKRPDLPKVLVGSKTDLRHKQTIGASEGRQFGVPENMDHLEVSAASNDHVEAIFSTLAANVLRYRKLGTVVPLGLPSDFQVAYEEATEADAVLTSTECTEHSREYRFLFRILLIGAARSGKTSMRLQLCKKHFSPHYIPTVGFDYSTKCLLVDGDLVQVQIWDVSGDQVFEQTRRGCYKGADGFIVMYDVQWRH